MRPADQIDVPREDQEELRRWLRSGLARKRLAQRVRIVLMSTKPISAAKIADQLGIVRLTVYKWRSRYREAGLAGLKDRARPGRPLKKRPPTTVETSPVPALVPELPPPALVGAAPAEMK
ncbi:MAG TPA: helix-turn-helix domain-containing protein [Polyangia bacterium]|nr:helix-turn-helix domain-containing protein [Polyangia bacterium]